MLARKGNAGKTSLKTIKQIGKQNINRSSLLSLIRFFCLSKDKAMAIETT